MDLPTLITSLFDGVENGVLIPVLNGMYSLTPIVIFLAIVFAILTLIFAERTATKVGSLITIAIIAYLWPHIPELVTALLDYNIAAVTPDAASAAAGITAPTPDVSAATPAPDAGSAPSLEELQGA